MVKSKGKLLKGGSFLRRKVKKTIISVIAMVVMVVISISIVFSFDMFGITGKAEEITITVEEGESISAVASDLKDKKIILSEKAFLLYIKLSGINPVISFGEHKVNSKMSYKEILSALSNFAYKKDVKVVIPEKITIDEIAEILAKNNICSESAFLTAAKGVDYTFKLSEHLPSDYRIALKLEGYLYPDTYFFYENDDPVRVLNVILANTDSKITEEMIDRAEELDLSVNELFAFASVVEAEACGRKNEMNKVAAVFWNRLKYWGDNPLLQSDPTTQYPYNNKYYNTYERGGLPVGPICNVTIDSINAVLYPDESCKAYFFVTDINGKYYYNLTDTAHESTIASLKKQGLWEN